MLVVIFASQAIFGYAVAQGLGAGDRVLLVAVLVLSVAMLMVYVISSADLWDDDSGNDDRTGRRSSASLQRRHSAPRRLARSTD